METQLPDGKRSEALRPGLWLLGAFLLGGLTSPALLAGLFMWPFLPIGILLLVACVFYVLHFQNKLLAKVQSHTKRPGNKLFILALVLMLGGAVSGLFLFIKILQTPAIDNWLNLGAHLA